MCDNCINKSILKKVGKDTIETYVLSTTRNRVPILHCKYCDSYFFIAEYDYQMMPIDDKCKASFLYTVIRYVDSIYNRRRRLVVNVHAIEDKKGIFEFMIAGGSYNLIEI